MYFIVESVHTGITVNICLKFHTPWHLTFLPEKKREVHLSSEQTNLEWPHLNL